MSTTNIYGLLVLFVSVLTTLTACSPTEIPTIPPSTSTSILIEETPTSLPIVTVTPGVTHLQFPSVNCCKGSSLDVGTYEIPSWLDIPLSVEIGEGWRVLNEKAALLFLIGRGRNVQNNPSQMVVFLNISDESTPETLITSVQRSPELTSNADPVNVNIAGFPGLQLDSITKPNPEYAGNDEEDIPPGVQFLPVFARYFTPGFLWTTSSPEARVRTIVLTVKDQTLLLYLESPQEEFDVFMNEASQLLESLNLAGN